MATGGSGGAAGGSPVCAVAQTQCTDGCKSLMSDNLNCGTCGRACTTGQVCTNGACACTSPLATCPNGTCADLQGDGNNCGACGTVCAAG
jgi:hypothetical protein